MIWFVGVAILAMSIIGIVLGYSLFLMEKSTSRTRRTSKHRDDQYQ